MKKLKCNQCLEEWYIEEEQIKKLQVCPFCRNVLQHQVSFEEIDSLGKAVGQGFHHGKLMPELHLPDGYGSSGIAVCVGNVEHIAQTVLGRGGIEQSNAMGAFVDPAPKPIPDVDPSTGGGVGLLFVDQQLLDEVVLVVVRGGAKKSKVLRLGGKHLCFQPFRRIFGDFVLACHIIPPIRASQTPAGRFHPHSPTARNTEARSGRWKSW